MMELFEGMTSDEIFELFAWICVGVSAACIAFLFILTGYGRETPWER